jgi:hypothetical protein
MSRRTRAGASAPLACDRAGPAPARFACSEGWVSPRWGVMVFPFAEREIVLRADFDCIEEGDVVSVPVRFDGGPRPPQRGEFVYLLDGTGNGCVGFVAKVRDGVARVMPVWDTWMGPGDPPTRRRRREQGGVHRGIDPASLESSRSSATSSRSS